METSRATIDYFFAKLDSLGQTLTPKVESLSEQYVRYTLFRTDLELFIYLSLSALFAILLFFALHKRAVAIGRNDDETAYVILVTITGCCLTALVFVSIWCLYDVILAHGNPEMYTLTKVLGK